MGSWLPDGILSNQKSKFGYTSEGLSMEYVDTFYGYLLYFTAIYDILLPFGVFYGHLEYFSRSGMLYREKSGNPGWDALCNGPHDQSDFF
jgi:hypothetical protein